MTTLREIFYFDKETLEPIDNKQYDPIDDESIVQRDDTRKTRLTLRQINKTTQRRTRERATLRTPNVRISG